MRVGVDATELRPGAPGGVRTAVRLLLSALAKWAPEVDLVALAPAPVPVPPGVKLQVTGGPASPRRWRSSRALRRALGGLDVFHSPVTAFPSWPGPVCTVTVHELPFTVNFRLEGPVRALVQWFWLSRAMGRCKALFAPSRATVEQMRIAHPAACAMTRVVPHPAPPAPAREQHGHDGSILFVGRLDKRKCVEALLGAAAAVPGEIRLVGRQAARARSRVESAADRHGVRDRVRFFGVVDDDTLDFLYRKACVVALPSASEGFGFPVLEALARGVPVLVAQGTGAAETGGAAAFAVDTVDRDAVASALRRAADPEVRRAIAVAGPARALEFTPERTARGYVEAWRDALDR